jgi:sec-independent protein translocase protein TatA
MLFGLHWIWGVVILAIVLILFGVGRLPSLGEGLGRGIREFRKSISGDDSAKNPKTEPGKDSGSAT